VSSPQAAFIYMVALSYIPLIPIFASSPYFRATCSTALANMPPITSDENNYVEACLGGVTVKVTHSVLRRHERRICLSTGDWDVWVTLSSRDPEAAYGILPAYNGHTRMSDTSGGSSTPRPSNSEEMPIVSEMSNELPELHGQPGSSVLLDIHSRTMAMLASFPDLIIRCSICGDSVTTLDDIGRACLFEECGCVSRPYHSLRWRYLPRIDRLSKLQGATIRRRPSLSMLETSQPPEQCICVDLSSMCYLRGDMSPERMGSSDPMRSYVSSSVSGGAGIHSNAGE
jgi:hypothetical protein